MFKLFGTDQEEPHMRRKVLSLSQSFNRIKDVNLQLAETTSKALVDHPLESVGCSKRWKIKSSYGDIGFKYSDEQAAAYVASRMPAVFCACFRVLSEVPFSGCMSSILFHGTIGIHVFRHFSFAFHCAMTKCLCFKVKKYLVEHK